MTTTTGHELDTSKLAILNRRRETVETDLANTRDGLACDAQSASAHDLAYRLMKLAVLEGRLFILRSVLHFSETGRAGQIQDWLMTSATRGAEDTWSGRVNDVARSRHDGVLNEVRETFELLRDR